MTNNESPEAPLNEPIDPEPNRIVSKRKFLIAIKIVWLFLFVCEMVSAKLITNHFGWKLSSIWFQVFTWLNLLLAYAMVARFFKLVGRSRSQRSKVVYGRKLVLQNELSDRQDAVSIRTTSASLSLVFVILGIASGVVFFVIPEQKIKDVIYGYLISIFFFVSGLFLLYSHFWGRPSILADSNGLTCYRRRSLRLRQGFFPWSEVHSCEVETVTDTVGNSGCIIKLLDWSGNQIVDVETSFVPRQDQERLVQYILSKLRKEITDD